jgi:hypothetical protein
MLKTLCGNFRQNSTMWMSQWPNWKQLIFKDQSHQWKIYIFFLFAEIYVEKLDGTQKQNPSIYLKYWVIICKLRFL